MRATSKSPEMGVCLCVSFPHVCVAPRAQAANTAGAGHRCVSVKSLGVHQLMQEKQEYRKTKAQAEHTKTKKDLHLKQKLHAVTLSSAPPPNFCFTQKTTGGCETSLSQLIGKRLYQLHVMLSQVRSQSNIKCWRF